MHQERSFIPSLALNILKEAEESFRTHNSFTEDTLLNLYSIYGYTLTKAVETVDRSNTVIEYTIASGLRRVFVVNDDTGCFYVRDHINWCRCDSFRQFVLKTRTRLTCKHVLAVQIAKIAHRHKSEVITDERMSELLDHGHVH